MWWSVLVFWHRDLTWPGTSIFPGLDLSTTNFSAQSAFFRRNSRPKLIFKNHKKNHIFLFWETEKDRAWNKLDSNLGKMNFLFEMQNWTYRPLPSRQDIKTWPEILKREAGYVGISSHQLFYPKNSHFLIIRSTFCDITKKVAYYKDFVLKIDLMQKRLINKGNSYEMSHSTWSEDATLLKISVIFEKLQV